MRVLLPRTVRPAILSDNQLASIRERYLLYVTTTDANVLATLTPQLVRDVRTLVDHHDALSYDREEAAPSGGREPSPDDALRQIALCLTRFEQSVDLGERSTLQRVLAPAVDPLLRRIDEIVAEARISDDGDGRITVPPFGWALQVEEAEERDKDYPRVRNFEVGIGYVSVCIQIKVMAGISNPWSLSLLIDGKTHAWGTGVNAIDVLRNMLDWFLRIPEAAPYVAAGFETSAIVAEFNRVGQWLTPEEQDRLSAERRARAADLAERVKPEIERILREHGVDTEGLRVTAYSASPISAWRPRTNIELEFGEPLKE